MTVQPVARGRGSGDEDVLAELRHRLAADPDPRGPERLGPATETAVPPPAMPFPGGPSPVSAGDLAAHIGRSPRPMSTGGLLDLAERATAELFGLGDALHHLLGDPAITDVLVNGAGGVWVDRGNGLEPAGVRLGGEDEVRRLAVRLAAVCGRRLDEAAPVADGALPGGVRLHAVLPPISAEGTLISLRVQKSTVLLLPDLVAAGMVPRILEPVLRALVETRANVLVSGAAGVGKTTLMAAMLSLAAPTERLVCIEEAVELHPVHPHVVHLQVRRPNVQDVGAVEMAELVRAAMRMRPDRLVLGECRGAEVREVLGALNTGHDGGWATVHANTAQDVPARLVALGALAGMDPATVTVQAASALDAVVHLDRRHGRRVAAIGMLGRQGTELVCAPALLHRPDGRVDEGPAWPELAERLDSDLDVGGR